MTKRGLVLVAGLLVAVAGRAEEFHVSVQNFIFIPADLEIEVGDTVTWTNEEGLHNVVAPGLFRCANGCDGEGGNGDPAKNAWSFSRTFNSVAEIDYFCEIHLGFGMVGSISVVAGEPTLAVTGGSCPGTVEISGSNFTPNKEIGMVGAANLSGFVKGGTFCNGAVFEVGEPFTLPATFAFTDSDGSFTKNISTVAGRCFVEALDLNGTCLTSNAVDTSP